MEKQEEERKTLQLEKILDKAVGLGASYADIRYQDYDFELITVENKALKSYSSRRLSGVGIRVAIKGAIGFASTSDLRRSSLERTLGNAVKAAKSIKSEKKPFSATKINETNVKLPIQTNPIDVSPEKKVSITLEANKAAWISDEIKSAITNLGLSSDARLFISSEGANVRVETSLVGLQHQSVAKVNGVMERVPYSESMCAGFEFIQSKDWNSFTADISDLAIEAARSKTPPPGTYPVVVDPEILGVVLHEAFGHASEGDLVFTGESVLHNKLGVQLASESVTIVDEGMIEGGYFYPFDDEGTKKERTVILENGFLKRYIHDRHSALQFLVDSTGNGRAQDFESMPIVRQTNTYLQPRDHKLEELIEDIDFGIYVREKGWTGGQVEPGMGTFTFNVGPSKIIRNGEVAETVREVVIGGSILETLKTVDAVGKDLKIVTNVFGGCGKGGQRASVGIGGPHVRVRKMTVGGR
ncbi:MAG: TldD/PmbA family protein [Candidatus Bathyarchaeota archaeon]|nr:TldD/PmbA family protein [Candidatus Bathyarchaeota archaeon]